MKIQIREARESDMDFYVYFTGKLSRFNRDNHKSQCKYDNYEKVLSSITADLLLILFTVKISHY